MSSPWARTFSRSGRSPGARYNSINGIVRWPSVPCACTTASSATSGTQRSETCNAMQCSLAPRIACIRALSDLPAPTPGPNEVLVRVHASSVNPADNGIAAGMLKQMGIEYEYPVILGRDYAGIVAQTGADVTRYAVGDEVFGFLLHANPTVRDGTWAELITVPQDMFIAKAPE